MLTVAAWLPVSDSSSLRHVARAAIAAASLSERHCAGVHVGLLLVLMRGGDNRPASHSCFLFSTDGRLSQSHNADVEAVVG
jgi:hypothetical protein